MTATGITFRERADDDPAPPLGAADKYVQRHESELERALAALEQARVYADGYDPGPVPEHADETPPTDAYARSAQMPMPEDNEYEERQDGQPAKDIPIRNFIDWASLAARRAPKFEWIWQDWLSAHPTLLAGRGGIGKSLFTQQLATALATGADRTMRADRPIRVLYWACEDDSDELWRRQERICAHFGIGLDALADRLTIDSRFGLENTLYSLAYARPVWTGLLGELQQQVNDLSIDVLMLDNLGQLYGANENDRHHVTTFTNGVAGMVRGRPFCPVFLGHPAKDSKSEYAGNAAWENAVRMRWFLSDRLPDEPIPEGETEQSDQTLRFLCKRKANYSTKDVIRFRIDGGILKPESQIMEEMGGNQHGDSIDRLYEARAEATVLEALERIGATGKSSSDTPGPSYLPKQILEFNLHQGASKRDLERAMRRLMMAGSMKRAEIGKYPNRTPKYGLVRVTEGE